MSADARIDELGLVLPPPARPVAAYVTFVQTGNVVYTSGHGPQLPDGSYLVGKVGVDATIEDGMAAARQTGLSMLATLRDRLGSLDRVTRIVKVLGMVNCSPDFTDHPMVINGFSELMADVFGDAGRHARSAVGVVSLPSNTTIEIEAIVEIL